MNVFIFRKVRDFGTVISHSFDLIKAEYRRLGKAFLIYVLPCFIVTGILLVLVQTSMIKNMENGLKPGVNIFQSFNWTKTGLSYLLQLLNFTILGTVIYSFLNIYLKKRGEFDVAELKGSLLKLGVKLLVINIIVGIMVLVACVFLVIPGIYLSVVLSLVTPIVVFEDAGFGQALRRSFEIIKGSWWKTFGILFVGAVIVYLFSIILGLPLIIATFVKAFHAVSGQSVTQIYTPGYIIVSTIISIIQTFAWSLVIIFISVQYFSLVEEKERPTLQAKIDRINEEQP
ncbi:MAG: hypothetical protein ABFD10_20555 [Prolixibacteraceae bacterium]